jgi:hypothetical protein
MTTGACERLTPRRARGRSFGDPQMIGFCLPLWAMTLPPTPDDEWNRNLTVIADELAQRGGRSML